MTSEVQRIYLAFRDLSDNPDGEEETVLDPGGPEEEVEAREVDGGEGLEEEKFIE